MVPSIGAGRCDKGRSQCVRKRSVEVKEISPRPSNETFEVQSQSAAKLTDEMANPKFSPPPQRRSDFSVWLHGVHVPKKLTCRVEPLAPRMYGCRELSAFDVLPLPHIKFSLNQQLDIPSSRNRSVPCIKPRQRKGSIRLSARCGPIANSTKPPLQIRCGPCGPTHRLHPSTLPCGIHRITMASPPYIYSPTALSPPASSRSQLPPINTMTGKRKPTDGAGAPALKRRKASTMSVTSGAGSAHPLRQTSFPPDEFGAGTPTDARSPSVDIDAMSFVSGSQVSAAAAPIKKKRGRKSKAEKALQREQTPSAAGGKASSAVGGVSDVGGRGGKSGAGAADDADGEDDGPTEVAATGTTMTKEQKEEEHRARGMLINAFSEDQFDRFENWRAANFSKAGVRRVGLLQARCPFPAGSGDEANVGPNSSSTRPSRSQSRKTSLSE
jgi:hypothetical protein